MSEFHANAMPKAVGEFSRSKECAKVMVLEWFMAPDEFFSLVSILADGDKSSKEVAQEKTTALKNTKTTGTNWLPGRQELAR